MRFQLHRRGNCRQTALGSKCEVGLRKKTYNVLTGSVLSVWNKIEEVLTHDGNRKGTNSKMQVRTSAKFDLKAATVSHLAKVSYPGDTGRFSYKLLG